jgi:hypothetical protein
MADDQRDLALARRDRPPTIAGVYRSEIRFGCAVCEYWLISLLRIFLRRIRAAAESATADGVVPVSLGGRW